VFLLQIGMVANMPIRDVASIQRKSEIGSSISRLTQRGSSPMTIGLLVRFAGTLTVVCPR
jgi:hypothetical protein